MTGIEFGEFADIREYASFDLRTTAPKLRRLAELGCSLQSVYRCRQFPHEPVAGLLRLNQTVVPAPAVRCLAASPLTTATSTQPELPGSAINEPVGFSP